MDTGRRPLCPENLKDSPRPAARLTSSVGRSPVRFPERPAPRGPFAWAFPGRLRLRLRLRPPRPPGVRRPADLSRAGL